MAQVNLTVMLGMVNKLSPGLQHAEGSLRSFRAKAAAAGEEFRDKWGSLADTSVQVGTAMSVAGATIVGSMVAATKAVSDYGSQLWDMKAKTGGSVEQLSALRFAAEQTGGTMEGVGTAYKFMNRAAAEARDGSKSQAEAFGKLGISVQELASLSPDELFLRITDGIRGLGSAQEKTSVAMTLFGRSGAEMLPMINDASGGVRALIDQARKLGLVMSDDVAKAADEFGDAADVLKRQTQGAFYAIGAAAMPALIGIVNALSAAAGWMVRLSAEHPALAKGMAYVALGAGLLLSAIGPLLIALPSLIQLHRGLAIAQEFLATGGLARLPAMLASSVTAMKAFAAASWQFLISPAGIITVAIAGLLVELAYLMKAYRSMKDELDKAKASVAQEKAFAAQAESKGVVTFDETARKLGYSEGQIRKGLDFEDARKVSEEMKRRRAEQKAAGLRPDLRGMQAGNALNTQSADSNAEQQARQMQQLLSGGGFAAGALAPAMASPQYTGPSEIRVVVPTQLDGRTIAQNEHLIRMVDGRASAGQRASYNTARWGAQGRE
jgi:hypothetical protein